jgi:hypothetical protein
MSKRYLWMSVPLRNETTGRLELATHLDPQGFWSLTAEIEDTERGVGIVALRIERADLAHERGVKEGLRSDTGWTTAASKHIPFLTADMLKSIRLTEFAQLANQVLGKRGHRLLRDPTKMRARDDRYWATWASHYVRACERAPRSPIAALAEQFGMERSQVRDTIHNCRAKGYLTGRGSQGRSGGQLTEKARLALHPQGSAQ